MTLQLPLDQSLEDIIQKTIPDYHAMMVIDKQGNLASYLVCKSCADEHNLSDLQQISKIISIRYNLGGFQNNLGGLESTVNVFKDHFLIVRSILKDKFLAVMVPKTLENLPARLSAVLAINESLLLAEKIVVETINGLKRVSNDKTGFQKNREEYLKLQVNKYTLVANVLKSESDKSYEKINNILKSSANVSLSRISEDSGLNQDEIQSYLKQQQSSGKILQLDQMKEISCDRCGSVKIDQSYHCPSCNSSNFKQGKLIEHYACGNVSTEDSYQNDTCPKCRKEIKVLGVDYKVMSNFYSCNDCGEKFPEVSSTFHCLKCDNKFALENVKWKTSSGFKLAK